MKGYFMISKQIFESPIWKDDPHCLKLFMYIIGNCRFKKEPKRYPGFECKRGEMITSLSELAENNEYMYQNKLQRWSKGKISRMLERLENEEYIKLLADTYGTHIRCINYDDYQNPEMYADGNREPKDADRKPSNSGGTLVELGQGTKKKVNKVNKEKNKMSLDLAKYLLDSTAKAQNKKLVSSPAGSAKHIQKLLKKEITPGEIRQTIDWLCHENMKRTEFRFVVQSGDSLVKKWDGIQTAISKEYKSKSNINEKKAKNDDLLKRALQAAEGK